MTVRVREVDRSDERALDAACHDLVSGLAGELTDTERVVLLPDLHYPFHPSTGLVTDPSVVAAVLAAVDDAVSPADLVVAGAGGRHVGGERAARYLGYQSVVEATEARFLPLDDAPTEERETVVDGRSVGITVPAPLAEATVLVVPTARTGRATSVAGAMATLARATSATTDTPREVVGASRSIAPAGVVLDATTTFTARPHAAGLLVAGRSPATVDRALATLLGVGVDAESAIELAGGDGPPADAMATLHAAAESVPAGTMPRPGGPGRLARAGYRAYTAVSGDAYPPQLLDR